MALSKDKGAREFYCTSRYLAERLACRGYAGTRTTNIYNPAQMAWTYELTPQTAEIIQDFFVTNGKGVPVTVKNYLASIAADPGNGEGGQEVNAL